MKKGCKLEGKCAFKKIRKVKNKGRRSNNNYHAYCVMDGLCNQQCNSAPKCDAPETEPNP